MLRSHDFTINRYHKGQLQVKNNNKKQIEEVVSSIVQVS